MRPQSMAARRLFLVDLLRTERIRNQAELLDRLAEAGFSVTQATVSRDLDELGAVKVAVADGVSVYAIPADGAGSPSIQEPDPGLLTGERFARIGAELIMSIDYSANNVVLCTPPGAAQYVASALDRTAFAEILGTVAGDDTILIVTAAADGGRPLAEQMIDLINRRAGRNSAKLEVK